MSDIIIDYVTTQKYNKEIKNLFYEIYENPKLKIDKLSNIAKRRQA